MSAPYGVTPTGFSTKTLPEALSEIEQVERAAFGSDLILDPQSPLGQLNGVFVEALAKVWEMGQGVYNSFDVDQSEGPRLDTIAKLRRLSRMAGESDVNFRQRIKNSDFGNVKRRNLYSLIANTPGVTWLSVIENDRGYSLDNGLPSHSLAIAVVGGLDDDVANQIWLSTVSGIGLYGNVAVSIIPDNFCRSVQFIRPIDVPLKIEVNVSIQLDNCECAPPSPAQLAQAIVDGAGGMCGLINGDLISPNTIRQIVAGQNSIIVEQVRLSRVGGTLASTPIQMTILERPIISLANIVVNYVSSSGQIAGEVPLAVDQQVTTTTTTTTTTITETVSPLGTGTIV